MALELGKVNVADLTQNNYKVLGIGINRNSDSNGIFATNYTTLSQAKDNLKNLILTRKGERLMQPDFGCDIYKVLFQPIVEGDIESTIDSYITDAVNTWLPYLSIDRIDYDYDENDIDMHKISLQIHFSLLSNKNLGDSVTITVNN
jgi:hypothetical protein